MEPLGSHEKQAFLDDFPLRPQGPPPKSEKSIFIVVSPSLSPLGVFLTNHFCKPPDISDKEFQAISCTRDCATVDPRLVHWCATVHQLSIQPWRHRIARFPEPRARNRQNFSSEKQKNQWIRNKKAEPRQIDSDSPIRIATYHDCNIFSCDLGIARFESPDSESPGSRHRVAASVLLRIQQLLQSHGPWCRSHFGPPKWGWKMAEKWILASPGKRGKKGPQMEFRAILPPFLEGVQTVKCKP